MSKLMALAIKFLDKADIFFKKILKLQGLFEG